jgi:transposase
MARNQVSIPLDIPDVKVLQTEFNRQGELIITVESTRADTRCRRCGQSITQLHGHDSWVKIRYLPVFGRASYLRYRPKRYYCSKCDTTTTQQVDWHEPNSPHSTAYEDHLLLQLVNASVQDVSIKEALSYDSVLGVLERRIRSEVDWGQYNSLNVLGIDEIALKKGHRDFVVIVTARLADKRLVILGVLENREKDTIIEFLRSIPIRLLKTIHTVCSDMYEGFIEAVREEVKQAHLVVDRFHVTQKYRGAVDHLRKHELRRLKQELPEADYQQLKGSMWALRKNRQDLRADERKVLRTLFSHSSDLKAAYDLQNQLTAIFDLKISKPAAKIRIKAWVKRVKKSGLTCFNEFLGTLEHWLEEITNFFLNRANSGFVEGFNNRIKVLKRRCYGLYNLKHIFQRIFLDLEGYGLFAP